MRIIRYSVAAFKPQEQTHHEKHIQYHLSGEFNIEDYPEFLRYEIKRIHEQKADFYKEHLEDLRCGIRNCFWPAAFVIEVDECPYLPFFEEPVSGVIVHCGIQAHIFNGNCGHMFFQFVESDKEID